MDARDLFEIIGRLYAANAELTKEIDARSRKNTELIKAESDLKAENNELRGAVRLRDQSIVDFAEKVDELEKEIEGLKRLNKEYLGASDELKKYIKTLEAAKVVDAGREEETLNQDGFFD